MTTNDIRSLCSLNGNKWQADKLLLFAIQQSQTAHAIKCH